MKCLFCKTEINNTNNSIEHIIPKFLGGHYVLYNVCKNCNSEMGEGFERELSQNTVIKFFQAFYHMKNRSGKFIVPDLKLKYTENMHIKADDEGHLFMYTNSCVSDDGYRKISIEIDQTESKEKIEELINKKVSRLNKKNNREDLGYEITRIEKKLVQGTPKDFSIKIDNNVLKQLCVKIAYEFSCICLGSKYFESNIAEIFRKIILDDEDYLILNDLPIKLSYDKRQATYCINKVAEIASENTHNIYDKNKLNYPSHGNYTHEIVLIHKQGKIFARINLFNIIYGEICVSDNGSMYGFEKGEIIKLKMGMWDNKLFKKIITNYEELKRVLM